MSSDDAEKDDWDEDSPWMKEEGGGRYEDTTEDFTVEPARSSRSTCRRCRNKIEKGALRIGHNYGVHHMYGHDSVTTDWYHLGCMRKIPKIPLAKHIPTIDALGGYASLPAIDRGTLERWLAGDTAAVAKAAAEKAAAAAAEEGEKKKKKAKAKPKGKTEKKKKEPAAKKTGAAAGKTTKKKTALKGGAKAK